MNYVSKDIYTSIELEKLISSKEIDSNIIIRGENIKTLKGIERVSGSLGLSDSTIKDLGDLKEVKGNFFISTNSQNSYLISLNNLEFVDGDMYLRYSNIEDLGALKKVGGKLNLRDSKIKNLGSLEFVGGDLFLPKALENEIDLNKINVKGKIRFWKNSEKRPKIISKSLLGYLNFEKTIPHWNHKYISSYNEIREANAEQLNFYKEYKINFLNGKYIDLQGNDNYSFVLFFDLLQNQNFEINELQSQLKNLTIYYPKTKTYGERAIIERLEDLHDFEKAWSLILLNNYINVRTIIDYEYKLNRELLDGDLIVKLGGFSHLTELGQKNIYAIIPYADKRLETYKTEKESKFFELFVQNGKPLKVKKTPKTDEENPLTETLKNHITESIYEYSPEYYEGFFLSKAEYEHYKAIDDYQVNSGYHNPFPHVVEKAIFCQCRLILKQAEDLYRNAIGMPKIGEGWISETELYYKISDYFKDDKVINHASPIWLGRQHLDIYFPKFNIGIEYQGAQHYEPIDFFGGQEAFEKTVERDNRKKELCEKHNCHLIYVEKGYDFIEIITEIEKIKITYDNAQKRD